LKVEQNLRVVANGSLTSGPKFCMSQYYSNILLTLLLMLYAGCADGSQVFTSFARATSWTQH